GADDGEEEDAVAGEAKLREAVAGERRHDGARERGDRGDEGTVEQEAAEGLALEDLAVVVEVAPAAGEDRDRQPLDLRHGLERRDRHPEEGKHNAEGAGRYQRRRQRAEPRRLQYATRRRKSRDARRMRSSTQKQPKAGIKRA